MKAYVKAPKRRSSSKSTSLRSRSTSRSQKDVPTTSAKPTAAEGRMKKTTVPKRRDSMRGPSTTLILRTKGAVTRSQFKLREELGMNKETKKPGASRKRDKSNSHSRSRSRSRSRSQSSARKQLTTSRQVGRAKKQN